MKEKASKKLANGQNIDYSEKENGPRASSAPALGLNTIIFKHVYWYMQQISGERLQDHWSSGFNSVLRPFQDYFSLYETGLSVGGQKRENPEKNHLTHPQAELGLSRMWTERATRHSGIAICPVAFEIVCGWTDARTNGRRRECHPTLSLA